MPTSVANLVRRAPPLRAQPLAATGDLQDPRADPLQDPLRMAPGIDRRAAFGEPEPGTTGVECAPTRETPVRFDVEGEAHAVWAESDGELWMASRPTPIAEAL